MTPDRSADVLRAEFGSNRRPALRRSGDALIPESMMNPLDLIRTGEPAYIPPTAWIEHGPFALWLTRFVQPRMIVELGSHHGYSYFCFCQAVAEEKLTAKCFAVDTWQGDEHAGFYGEDVYRSVMAENRKYDSFSTLIRSTFNDAVGRFADGSIDILHIDGRHFYDDVKEDFETWLPKVSDRGIVLFHDTEVRERNFGVHRFWGELRRKYSGFSFEHCFGLGVLCVGAQPTSAVKYLFDLAGTPAGLSRIRALFESCGAMVNARQREQTIFAQRGLKPPALATRPARIAADGKDAPGRNDPCHCGSGKRYKHCHGSFAN